MAGEVDTVRALGATSDIGRAVVRKLANGRWALQLAARESARLAREVRDFQATPAP